MTSARTRTGLAVELSVVTAADHAELFRLFVTIVAAGEGYPQDPGQPVSFPEFAAYWLAPATVAVIARLPGGNLVGDLVGDLGGDVGGDLVGAYMMKPNGVGRAAHVANAGYLVAAGHRGQGLGELLVQHSFEAARAHGFDAMQFNFVFETNPARRLYERLGFTDVGRVPDVIDGEAVHIYWRALD